MQGCVPCLSGLFLCAAILTGCNGDHPVQPTRAQNCASVSASQQSIALGPDASSFSLSVAAPGGCSWSVTVSAAFLTITSATGKGNGTVEILASENLGAERTGTVTVGTTNVSVRQAAVIPCALRVSPTAFEIRAEGDDATVDVSVIQGKNCAWTSTSSDSFLTIASAASGIGSGQLRIAVALNDYIARVGHVTVAGQAIEVNQKGGCRFDLFPTNPRTFDIPATPGSLGDYTIGLENWVGFPCQPPRAVSNDSFIKVVRLEKSTDAGWFLHLIIEANFGLARTGTVTAGDLTFTINQAGR